MKTNPFDVHSLHTVHDFFILLSAIDRKSVLDSRADVRFNSFPTVATPNLTVLCETLNREIIQADIELGNTYRQQYDKI